VTTQRFLTAVVFAALGAIFSGCQIGGSTVSEREGYFTWVDEQGRVRYTPIGEASPAAVPSTGQDAPVQDASDGPEALNGKSPDRSAEKSADEEFTPSNYPDAEELRSRGYQREADRPPYFTWRDADGNVRTTYYQPDTRTDEEKGFVAPPAGTTPASVYRTGDVAEPSEPVTGNDPDVFTILGIEGAGDNYLERFAETCCQALDSKNHERWQEGREFGIYLTEDSPVHRFLTGESPYQLVAFPDGDRPQGQLIRLRSFASKGVFVPSVVFLDNELNPVRLVTDLVSDFEPENWHRRGFLEARIPVPENTKERWMLLFTRDEDLEGQTVIETDRGPQKIPHVRIGEFGLTIVKAR